MDNTTKIKQCHSRSLEPYKCKLCPFETDLKVILTNHVNIIHKKSKNVARYSEITQKICLICNFQTHTILGLAGHVCRTKRKSLEKLHRFVLTKQGGNGANIESINVKVKKGYHSYKKTHDYTKENNLKRNSSLDCFQCPQCDYKTKTKQCLKSHLKRKHGDPLDITRHKCNQCSYVSKDRTYLKQHIFNKHTEAGKIKAYMCEECPFRTKARILLERHFKRIHMDLSEIKLFECTQCPYKSKQKCGLQNHILFQHTKPQDVKWFKCEHCLYRAKVKYQLKRHLKDKHQVEMVL